MTSGVAAVSVVVANLAIQHREAPHTSVAASPLAAGGWREITNVDVSSSQRAVVETRFDEFRNANRVILGRAGDRSSRAAGAAEQVDGLGA